MAISRELFLGILSLDTHDGACRQRIAGRANPDIKRPQISIGNASIIDDAIGDHGVSRAASRRFVLRLIAAGAGLPLLSGCDSMDDVHYRMTVKVGTPDGVRVGSTVRELQYYGRGGWFPFGESRGGVRVSGEAGAVDLPNGKTLYALMTGADRELDYAATVFGKTLGSPVSGRKFFRILPLESRADGNVMPMLVYFKSDNAKSITVLDSDSIEKEFGIGYSIKEISLEKTKDRYEANEFNRTPALQRTNELRGWLRDIGMDDPRVAAISGFYRN